MLHACEKYMHQVTPSVHHMMHHVMAAVAPLQSMLADAIGIVVIASMTWTLLLLKRRWFNTFLTRLTVNATETEDVCPASAFCAQQYCSTLGSTLAGACTVMPFMLSLPALTPLAAACTTLAPSSGLHCCLLQAAERVQRTHAQ